MEGDRKTPTNFAKTFSVLEKQNVIFPKAEEFIFVALKPKKKNIQSQVQQPPINESKVNNNSNNAISNQNNNATPGVNFDNQKENLRNKYSKKIKKWMKGGVGRALNEIKI